MRPCGGRSVVGTQGDGGRCGKCGGDLVEPAGESSQECEVGKEQGLGRSIVGSIDSDRSCLARRIFAARVSGEGGQPAANLGIRVCGDESDPMDDGRVQV